MTRRGLIANLDPKVERAELREFNFIPVERMMKDRGAYIAAALTIGRAYIAAGSPNVCGPLGSYEEWSEFVRSPLIWLGKEDPVKSMELAREADPVRVAVRNLIGFWMETIQLNVGYSVLVKSCATQSITEDFPSSIFAPFKTRVRVTLRRSCI
jgi:hypothetical protein